jgi:hypothetical protein
LERIELIENRFVWASAGEAGSSILLMMMTGDSLPSRFILG